MSRALAVSIASFATLFLKTFSSAHYWYKSKGATEVTPPDLRDLRYCLDFRISRDRL
jgi:hypothetical protein